MKLMNNHYRVCDVETSNSANDRISTICIFRHVSRLWMEFQPYLDGDLAVA